MPVVSSAQGWGASAGAVSMWRLPRGGRRHHSILGAVGPDEHGPTDTPPKASRRTVVESITATPSGELMADGYLLTTANRQCHSPAASVEGAFRVAASTSRL